jgi:hypothetical protein
MAGVMMTVELDPKAADLAHAAEKLGIDAKHLDAEFGVVAIDPDNNLYSVMAEESEVAGASERGGVEGPFANPPIRPFGPPKS